MAELVGGAFLSAALQVAFEKLASSEIFDFFRRRKLNDALLKKLHVILISVNQVIEDAEERQYKNPNVKKWLHELKDEVFNAEDILDEIETEASQQKLHAEFHPVTTKVRGLLTPSLTSFDKEIEPRIQKVLDSLEYLIKQNEILGLKARFGVGTEVGVNKKPLKRLPTSSLIDESSIYGRDAEKESIMNELLSHSDNQRVDVIAITGLGGMGKTTLAWQVYDDKRMKVKFPLRAWLTVSEEFDVLLLTKAILQQLNCSTKDDDDHRNKLKETLMGKKFFLVLDDVWNESHPKWGDLQAPFKYGAPGSKILVTTRNKNVANVMDSTHVHDLKQLRDEDCWKLFVKHAFNDQLDDTDPNLISIGREIVKKCGGLPLAIKSLGSLLCRKLSPQDWNKILRSDMWKLSEDDSNIIPSLRLSYHYLPSNLKRCFAYCCIFPKDYEIEKEVLVQLWMAEGLLHSNERGKSMDEVGNEVLNDLESRAFFEPSKSGNKNFVMHDLVNDLAQSVMGEVYLWAKDNWAQDISIKARYFSYLNIGDVGKHGDAILNVSHQLRSFMSFQRWRDSHSDDIKVILSTLGHLKYIRALSLKGEWRVERLPNDIGNLKHLRYLDLSGTQIKKLPDSICLLINLQTLKLKDCYRMTKLPSNLHKLVNLCHLDLEGSGIKKMPKNMKNLRYLGTSTEIVVEDNKGSNLKELGAQKYLRGRLIISELKNISDVTDVEHANIKDMHFDKLELHWGMNITNGGVSHEQEHILLDALQPNCGVVKEVIVDGYGGTRFSGWIIDLHFVVSLKLVNCRCCDRLPPLGQLPLLENLEIHGFDGLKKIGDEFYGNNSSYAPFRSLLYLEISHMKEWEEWKICYEGDSFACLQELSIWNCPKLRKSLPQHLPSLKWLRIKGCKILESWKIEDMPSCSLLVKDKETCTSGVMLCLNDCPKMESLPQGSFLSSLNILMIHGCPKLIDSRKDWGLHSLLSLEHITVGDNDFENVESFPEEGLLPPNLLSLRFFNCSKLKAINYRGLLHLQSLLSLAFEDCPLLTFQNFPDQQAFPKSLSYLNINDKCPLLKQCCRKEKGQDWPKISHISHVCIDQENTLSLRIQVLTPLEKKLYMYGIIDLLIWLLYNTNPQFEQTSTGNFSSEQRHFILQSLYPESR